jgi:exopolysaccharide production protein ExoY
MSIADAAADCLQPDWLRSALKPKRLALIVKRGFDVLVSGLLIVALSPVLLVTSLLIKLTSRGPVLYANGRIGYHGLPFRCFKFRSMAVEPQHAASDAALASAAAARGLLYKVKDDKRITCVGAVIRRTSIDELPQLFNVLRGDMSIVGPRPLVPFMLEHLPEFTEMRSLVRPGITGLWQVRDRGRNTSAEFMIAHDIEYVARFSLLLDFQILFRTPLVVLTGKGAY